MAAANRIKVNAGRGVWMKWNRYWIGRGMLVVSKPKSRVGDGTGHVKA